MLPDIRELEELIRTCAREELLPRFNRSQRTMKADGSWVTEADLAMQQRVQDELQRRWPQYGLLGEEMSSAEQERLIAHTGEGLWVLDPLDGTSNFAAGMPFFSVSLCLIVDGEVVLGLVYDPKLDESFSAIRGQGAWLNGEPLKLDQQALPLKKTLAAVDFKRLDTDLRRRIIEDNPYGSQRSLGSVALDWCWVAAGRFHVYLHGKQKLWDYGAGWLILQEAGGHSCTLDGRQVFNQSMQPRSAVAALDASLFHAWCDYLGVRIG